MKRLGWGGVLAVVVGIILAVLIREGLKEWRWQTQKVSPDRMHEILVAAQGELAKQLPKRIDQWNTLVETRVSGTNVTYVYRTSLSKSQIDLAAHERGLRESVCKTDMATMMRSGASYTYEYWDR